jgi:hypothetical protein
MLYQVLLRFLALRIEWHWFLIGFYKNKGNKLVESGISLTSEILISTSNKLIKSWMIAKRSENIYYFLVSDKSEVSFVNSKKSHIREQIAYEA